MDYSGYPKTIEGFFNVILMQYLFFGYTILGRLVLLLCHKIGLQLL